MKKERVLVTGTLNSTKLKHIYRLFSVNSDQYSKNKTVFENSPSLLFKILGAGKLHSFGRLNSENANFKC